VVELNKDEKERLEKLTTKGKSGARKIPAERASSCSPRRVTSTRR
jgi:hypothetical protein